MLKKMNVIRNGSNEKAIPIDCELRERLERVDVQASSSHLSVSGIEYCPPGQLSDL
jgi:hypothetical protein